MVIEIQFMQLERNLGCGFSFWGSHVKAIAEAMGIIKRV